jgi:hypothetical protein
VKLEVERVKLGDLRPYPGNARRGDVDAIAESLRLNGEYQPIVVQRSTGYVIVGNHRLQAAQRLGWTHLNAIYRDCSDEEARRILLADNRTAELGDMDDRALAELLRELDEEGLAASAYGEDYLDDLLARLQEEERQEPTVLVPDDGGGEPSSPSNVRATPAQGEYLDRYEDAETRFLSLIFPVSQYAWVVEQLGKVGESSGLVDTSHSAVLVYLLERATGDAWESPERVLADLVHGRVATATLPSEAAVAAPDDPALIEP